MSIPADTTENARKIVRAFYDGGARDDITSFAPYLAPDFELFVPPQLPWGGRYDRDGYLQILPQVATTLDFSRLRYVSFTAEGGHVVALIDIGVRGTDQSIMISEHWDIEDGVEGYKAKRLLVAYYDPTPLLEQHSAA